MNKSQTIKDIKKNQAGGKNSGDVATLRESGKGAETDASQRADSAVEHALAAVNAAELGASIIGELETLLQTIAALANSGEPTEDGARRQLGSIQKLCRHAVHFAGERSGDYGLVCDDLTEDLASLRGAA